MNVSSGPGFRFGSPPDLEGLGRDLREVAEAIAAHAQCESERDKAAVYPVSISAPAIHVILYVRRLRTKFLGDVPEPAFGMMLTILASRLDGGPALAR